MFLKESKIQLGYGKIVFATVQDTALIFFLTLNIFQVTFLENDFNFYKILTNGIKQFVS